MPTKPLLLTVTNPIVCPSNDWAIIGDFLLETYTQIAHETPIFNLFDEIQDYIDDPKNPENQNNIWYIITNSNQRTKFIYTQTPLKNQRVYYYLVANKKSVTLKKGRKTTNYSKGGATKCSKNTKTT